MRFFKTIQSWSKNLNNWLLVNLTPLISWTLKCDLGCFIKNASKDSHATILRKKNSDSEVSLTSNCSTFELLSYYFLFLRPDFLFCFLFIFFFVCFFYSKSYNYIKQFSHKTFFKNHLIFDNFHFHWFFVDWSFKTV